MKIDICQAKTADVGILQQLNNEVFVDNERYDDDLVMDWAVSEKGKTYFAKLVDGDDAVCFIAYSEHNPVGYIAARKKDFGYKYKKYLEIENMGVIPMFRSKGLGALLIEKLKGWGKAHGYERLYVNAYINNIKALSFYKRNRFVEIDISLQADIK